MFRRLAIIDAAQRVGFTLEETRDLLGSRDCGSIDVCRMFDERVLPLCQTIAATATSGARRRVTVPA